jgi:ATP-dependent helicase/DNAse subunit B
MRLITGSAGSGKTTSLVDRFVESLRANNHRVRLLVPTATLAQHLQNRIARDGFVFRRNLIQTLSHFVDAWAGESSQASEPVLYLLVEQAVARVNRPEFRRVAQLPGFSAAVARAISEFSSAGCDSARLAAHLPDAPLAAAFLAVYRELDRLLERRNLVLRGQKLEQAAARIRAEGLGGIETIWLDGFHVLPDPELAIIEALGRHADVTLTLSDTDGAEALRARLWALGFEEERAPGLPPLPERRLVRAPGIEREVDEIARRIVELAAAGRPFREIGIIVRTADTYVPILRSTLERFGIPARFYFDS